MERWVMRDVILFLTAIVAAPAACKNEVGGDGASDGGHAADGAPISGGHCAKGRTPRAGRSPGAGGRAHAEGGTLSGGGTASVASMSNSGSPSNGGTVPADCPLGETACGTRCTDTESDPLNCGMCGSACPVVGHAATSCESGGCQLACDDGYANCNSDWGDGCETPIAQGETVSSGCAVHMGCSGGAIHPPFMLCGSACIDLANDPENCGACGNACPPGLLCTNRVCAAL
jgi:hypothetical protein